MSGWDATHRVTLPDPWEGMWIEVYDNPPMGLLLDLGEQVALAMNDPRPEVIEKALVTAYGYIAAHNLTDREGRPLEWSLRSFAPTLVVCVLRAIGDDLRRGADTGPFDNRAAKRARSRAPSSRASRSRRASASGSSVAA